ncbi:MAG: hypothetical protein ACPLKQ_06005 [Candidatus Bathyarchaeales archaeon]
MLKRFDCDRGKAYITVSDSSIEYYVKPSTTKAAIIGGLAGVTVFMILFGPVQPLFTSVWLGAVGGGIGSGVGQIIYSVVLSKRGFKPERRVENSRVKRVELQRSTDGRFAYVVIYDDGGAAIRAELKSKDAEKLKAALSSQPVFQSKITEETYS